MLAKCANPACSTPFRRLHEGKLFQVETDTVPKGTNHERDAGTRSTSRRSVEHFWLCGECAPLVTLVFDQKQGVVTVPLPQAEVTKKIRIVESLGRPLPDRLRQDLSELLKPDRQRYES
jgi:hypothetical protein